MIECGLHQPAHFAPQMAILRPLKDQFKRLYFIIPECWRDPTPQANSVRDPFQIAAFAYQKYVVLGYFLQLHHACYGLNF